jgi:hypothetical protein
MLIIYIKSGKNNWFYLFAMMGTLVLVGIGYHLFMYLVPAKAESQKLWANYSSYIDSSGFVGSNLNTILSDVRKKEEQNDLITVQHSSQQSPIGFNSGLGVGLGASLGSSLGNGMSSLLSSQLSKLVKK